MKYRSKTVEVEAVQVTDEVSCAKILTWCDEHDWLAGYAINSHGKLFIEIDDLIKNIVANAGEWVVKDGDTLSVCSDDEFKRRYEAIEK